MQCGLPFGVLGIDVDARLGDQVGQSDLLSAESRPDKGRSTRIICLIDTETFIAVEKHVQADRVVALRCHVQSCHTHRCGDEKICAVLNQELDNRSVTIECCQVESCRTQLSTIAQIDVVGQTALEFGLICLFDLPVDHFRGRVIRT